MSLLTEEQIADILDILKVCGTTTQARDLEQWNENQPSTQFEPDWEKTPLNATKVYLDAVWFNSEMKEIDRRAICSWDRPTTPHPHAKIMAKYAEVAARRNDPWVEFELKIRDGNWKNGDFPIVFLEENEYRYIGETE